MAGVPVGGVCVLTAWFGSVHMCGRCGDGDGGTG